MNENNFQKLISQLGAIGFPEDTEKVLSLLSFFDQPEISIRHLVNNDLECHLATAYLQKKGSDYFLSHYDVTLRKYNPLPNQIINNISLLDLEAAMAKIPWNKLAIGYTSTWEFPEEELNDVRRVLKDMQLIEANSETRDLACQLKWRFWEGTPFDSFIPDLKNLKLKLEITQRYYNFERAAAITLNEGFRFLTHRWNEKVLKAERNFKLPNSPVVNGIEKKGERGKKPSPAKK